MEQRSFLYFMTLCVHYVITIVVKYCIRSDITLKSMSIVNASLSHFSYSFDVITGTCTSVEGWEVAEWL